MGNSSILDSAPLGFQENQRLTFFPPAELFVRKPSARLEPGTDPDLFLVVRDFSLLLHEAESQVQLDSPWIVFT